MSKIDLALLSIFIAGFLMFLFGANFYNPIVGYIGVYMWIGSIITYIVYYIYREFTKKPPSAHKP